MSLPEVTPERIADEELAAIMAWWAMVEQQVQNADAWLRSTGTITAEEVSWRTPDHGRLTRLLAHIAWQAAERDRLRTAVTQAVRELRHNATVRDPGLPRRATEQDDLAIADDLAAALAGSGSGGIWVPGPATLPALASVGEEPEEEDADA